MDNCLFCKIVNKEVPSEIIDETDKSMAFMDINPVANGHILVIPKKHYMHFSASSDEDLADLIILAKKIAKKINDSLLDNWGINYLSNEGAIAGQVIMHFHLHIIPKYGKEEGLKFRVLNRNVDNIEKIKKLLNK